GIHILIDLAGYTLYSCPEILALRPAPIQMQWLGYPNTMGAEFVQYLLADPWLVPPELAKAYSEEIIYLPHAFVASSPLASPEGFLSRTSLGLPEDCFVFCCFNNTDKVNPQVFATWMRILQQVPHSVLWLGSCPEVVQNNLRQSAQKHGVEPNRLYFATYLSDAQYLARYRLVDLFLDTTQYSAGSTGVAALWMGVPLLTCPGDTNASRMGASLCAATNLEPLICSNLADYERKAVHLATHPEELQALRQHLIEQRHVLPLFDLQGFVGHLEAALRQVWQRHSLSPEISSPPDIATVPLALSPSPSPSSSRITAPPLGTTDAQSPDMLTVSPQFPEWLAQHHLSLAFTTYESNQLFTLGLKPEGELAVTRRTFERAMGLAATPDRLYLSSKDQIWQLDNVLGPGEQYNHHDKLYLPRLAYTTGDLDTHDLAIVDPSAASGTASGTLPPLVFAATRFSCLATLSDRHSFSPVWHPPFISKLAPEDRCHLNGIAMVEGQPRYVTAISQSNVAEGWREVRATGGIVIDVANGETVATGLSMPHSPRWYGGKLWLLNSGKGELGYVDLIQGVFVPVAFCPGYLRGLAFWKDYAIVGLSCARDATFKGLPLDEQLARRHAKPRCGLLVINLHSGDIVHWVRLAGDINELYDVQVLPGVRSPTIAQRQREVFAPELHTGERRSWFAAPKTKL
ncbi:MAG TPA: TIGR03032 family protein, partial [Allocoleopsis sp.]